jgi:hypothetical protein
MTKKLGLALAVGVALFPSLSEASTVLSDFFQNACSSGLTCSGSSSGLIAEATITDLSGGGVSVDIALKDSSFAFFQAGQPPMVAFQAGATGTHTLSGTTPAMNSIGGVPTTWSLGGSTNTGGPGQFLQSAGYAPGHNTPFQFDIFFDLSGVTTGDFVANASLFTMAVDMCSGFSAAAGCGGTGFVGGVFEQPGTTRGGGEAPLPGGIVLFSSVLGGAFLAFRRRRHDGSTASASA